MLVLNLIKLMIIVLLISFFPIKKTILIATFLLPFQQAFTLNIAGTVRISDILYVSAFVGLVIKMLRSKIGYITKENIGSFIKVSCKKLSCKLKHNIGIVYFVYLTLGSGIIGFYLRDDIKNGLATLGVYNQSRLLVNVFTPLVALLVFIIGNYAGNQNKEFFQRILQVWSKALTLLSIYVIIQFVVINITGEWMSIPGEVLNYNTSFAYGIRRPWGFSIEPGALGSFLFFSYLMILNYLDKSILKRNTIIVSTIAILFSFSSIAIFAILSLWVILVFINWKHFKSRNKIFFVLLIFVSIIIALTNNTIFDATIGKVFVANTSKLDRQANMQILIRMFRRYPVFGVGAGNFGALRNLFSQSTLYPIKDFYDMPNVFYYGMLAEQGIVGSTLFIIFGKKLWKAAKTIGASAIIWLVPLAILIFTSSTIALDYMVFGFGLVIGQSQYIKNTNI